jgi:hypothetical protein
MNWNLKEQRMRTTEETLARIAYLNTNSAEDFFGAQRGDLIATLPFEDAKEFLTPEGVAKGAVVWDENREDTDDKIVAKMGRYMEFAVGKAMNHRGLSAGRSLDHYRAWTWVLGDEHFEAIEWANYQNYGAPVLLQIAEKYKFSIPTGTDRDLARFINMSQGQMCHLGCQDGCA